MRLQRVKQCVKCPWREGVDPAEIPGGYCREKHKALKDTLVDEHGQWSGKAMACHESKPGREYYCVGWLYNQLGAGNNIPLRFRMLRHKNAHRLQVVGKQRKTFEETLNLEG